jgi:hypothetical protein
MGKSCTAESILERTAEVAKPFCTRRAGHPHCDQVPELERDEALLTHARISIEAIASDTAPAELLAAEQGCAWLTLPSGLRARGLESEPQAHCPRSRARSDSRGTCQRLGSKIHGRQRWSH